MMAPWPVHIQHYCDNLVLMMQGNQLIKSTQRTRWSLKKGVFVQFAYFSTFTVIETT